MIAVLFCIRVYQPLDNVSNVLNLALAVSRRFADNAKLEL